MHEVWGNKPVCPVVAQFIHEQVVRRAELPPDEIVRARGGDDIDVVRFAQLRDEQRGVVERIRDVRIGRAEPGER